MKLTKNFEVYEFVYSITAENFNIDNRPSVIVVDRLKTLCEKVLQPLRDYMGVPIKITSGFRCAILNAKINGAKNSNHLYGYAADFICPKGNLMKAFEFIEKNCEFDELLFEHNKDGVHWVHVAYRQGNNRHKINRNYKA